MGYLWRASPPPGPARSWQGLPAQLQTPLLGRSLLHPEEAPLEAEKTVLIQDHIPKGS